MTEEKRMLKSVKEESPCLGVLRLPHSLGLDLPRYQTAGASGMDLAAALSEGETVCLKPLQRCLVPTGLIFEIPEGFEMQIRPRSGLALKHGLTCLNTPGTIDSDYRGEVKVLLINLSDTPFEITRGMRIAQAVIAPVVQLPIEEKEGLSSTERAEKGFGSTGTQQ